MGSGTRTQSKGFNCMSIDIDHILLEISNLPEYNEQLSLQISPQGASAEGRFNNLSASEKDFNLFAYDLPYTNSVISSLGMYRTRLMKMTEKTCYTYHWDPSKRMHIPFSTE